MPGNPVVGIDVDLKVANALAEMRKLGPVTDAQAKKISQSLGGAWKEAAAGAKKLGDTTSTSADKALKALGPLGGVLSRISPEAGAAASSIAGLTSAAEGFEAAGIGVSAGIAGAALLGLAEVAGVAYVAWRVYNDEAARAAVIAANTAAADQAMQPIVENLAASVTRLKVATGELSAEQAQLIELGTRAYATLDKATAASKKGIADLHAEQSGFVTSMVDMAESITPSWSPLGAAIRGMTTSSQDYQDQIDGQMASVEKASALTKEQTANDTAAIHATTEKTAADKRAKTATAEISEAYRDLERAYEDASAAMLQGEADQRTARKQLRAALTEDQNQQLDAIGKLRAAEDEAAAKRMELAARAGEDEAGIAAAVASVRAGFEEQITAVAQTEADKRAQLAEQEAAAATQAQRQRLQGARDLTGALIGLEQTVAEAAMSRMDTSTAAGKRAAMAAWKAQHAAAVAEAAILAALGVANAASSSAPPYNVIPIAIAAVEGATNVAAVAAAPPPSFHAGGLAPDERMLGPSKVLDGEGVGVVSKQGMSAANAGMRSAPQQVAVNLLVRHEHLDRVVAEAIDRGGETAQRIGRSRTVPFGHRRDTWQR